MNNPIKKRTKLTDANFNLIKKYQKASNNFMKLKKMNENAEIMASSMPKLLKVIKKMETINKELKDEIVMLKDAGSKALRMVNTINRAQREKKKSNWNNHYSPDVRD